MLRQLHILITLAILFAGTISACSNSEYPEATKWDDIIETTNYSQAANQSTSSEIIEYLPLDDSEYPYAGIPRIVIVTENFREIKDRETEIPAKLQIWGEKAPESEIMDLTIRGRGNSSWSLPKKSYKIEFIEKQSLLGMPKDRDWALIANHFDTTMIRNYVANYISSISNTPYTPKNQFVELFLNGEDKGIYQLYETLKVSKHRVNIGKDNFLLEVDNHPKSKDISFYVNHISNPIKIHSPSVIINDSNYNYIQQSIKKIDSILFSNRFLDDETGYKKYVDIDALVEWYVITEITKNASNRANWYMTFERDGKLKMGPFWDYDLAFGNTLWLMDANDIRGLWMDSVPWFAQFIQDSIFREKTKQRFIYFLSQKDSILSKIDRVFLFLNQPIVRNEKIWNTLNCSSCSSKDILKKYSSHLFKMKQWLIQRLEWLEPKFL